MYVKDVIRNMEDVFGMKKGYDKNPVACQRFAEVAEKLRSEGISELTPENRDKFEKITSEYITDRNYKTGTKFGWKNREQKYTDGRSTGTVSDYKMDIDEQGNLVEESKETRHINGYTLTYGSKSEYNKHGLGMRSEKSKKREGNNERVVETKSVITRNPDLVSAKIESSKTYGETYNKSEEKEVVTGETILFPPSEKNSASSLGVYEASSQINVNTLDVMDTDEMHQSMCDVRDGKKTDFQLKAVDGVMVFDGHPGQGRANYYELAHEDYTRNPNFDFTYSQNEAFRETAKEGGIRKDLEERVRTSKLKEIYDKVKYKIKSVVDKFKKMTVGEKSKGENVQI